MPNNRLVIAVARKIKPCIFAMRHALPFPAILAICVALVLPVAPVAADTDAAYGLPDNAHQVRQDWMLQCRGCHGAYGQNTQGVPKLTDEVAKFLHIAGGREYLVQVAGVAHAPLSDQRLADVLNWMLVTLDSGHLPADFQPYEAAEVAALRRDRRSDLPAERIRLLAQIAAMDKMEAAKAKAAEKPTKAAE